MAQNQHFLLTIIKPALCAWTQILLVAVMVIIESILAPDLLLFSRVNLIPAGLFIGVIYLNELFTNRTAKSQPS